MLEYLSPLAILFAAAYPLARALRLEWGPRLLSTATLGITGGPALAWLTGVLVPTIRPDLPLMLLAVAGSALLVHDFRGTPRPQFRSNRDLHLVLGAMVVVTAYQCLVLVRTHWDRGSLVVANLHPHDAFWHLAIAAMLRPGQDFATPWPPPNPVWADLPLTNYHPLSDVLVALLAPHDAQISAYFHVLPPLYGLIFAGGTAWVARQWGASHRAAALAVLLAGLCGSLGHLVALLSGGPYVWDSAFWLSQPWSMLNNPPLALSYGALLVGLAVLSLKQAPMLPRAIALFFLWGTSFGIKAYLPALVLPALVLATLLAPSQERRELAFLSAAAAAGAAGMLLLTTRGAAGLMVYDPGWILSTMLGQGDRLGELTVRTLRSVSQDVRPVVVFAWFGASLPLYLIGNLGVRVFGLRTAWRAFTGREVVAPGTQAAQRTAFAVSAIGLLLPVFLKQRGVEWNTIQFAYYALTLTCLWSAPAILKWLEPASGSRLRWSRAMTLASLALPTTLQMLGLINSGTIIPASEVAALRALRQQVPVGGRIAIEPGVIRSRPAAQQHGFSPINEPIASAYVAAISGRPIYYADPLTLDVLLLPGKDRLAELKSGLHLPPSERRKWLSARGIQAVYSLPPH